MKRREFIATAAGVLPPLAFIATRAWSRTGASSDGAVVSDPEMIKQRLVEEAKRIFLRNEVVSRMGRFHLPSFATYKRFYAWDSGWNVISQTIFDPEAALAELDAIFNFQVGSSRVPHEAVPPEMPISEDGTYKRFGRDLFDENARSYMLDPPSYLVAAEELYDATGDARVLALLPKMEKCLEYLTGPRDLFGDGLVSAVHRWEPGTDMAPSYDELLGINPWDPMAFAKVEQRSDQMIRLYAGLDWDLDQIKKANVFVLEDPGLNALTAAGALSVSRLFRKSGDAARADRWQNKAQSIVQAMEEHLWNERAGFFYPRYDIKNPRLCHRTSLTGLVVLMTGLVSENKAERVIADYLTSPRHFWTPWLVPFNSVSEMSKDPPGPLRGELWRGSCIWINMNWMAARAARILGREDIAREITRRTALMIDRHGFREYYRPQTGAGRGAKTFTWPALVLHMISEHGL